MTVSEGIDEFATISSSSGTANWLPFAAKGKSNVTKSDVNGYFVVERDDENVMTSTFRGRALKGMKVNTESFDVIVPVTDTDCSEPISVKVKELVVWNHDDMPLKSDVVPQAVALARLQQALGST